MSPKATSLNINLSERASGVSEDNSPNNNVSVQREHECQTMLNNCRSRGGVGANEDEQVYSVYMRVRDKVV